MQIMKEFPAKHTNHAKIKAKTTLNFSFFRVFGVFRGKQRLSYCVVLFP